MKQANPEMETKNINGGDQVTHEGYEDFEPFCNWHRDDKCVTLVIHLPAFKKEELRVQITNRRTLKIFGERPLVLDATKRSRFYKEIVVPSDTNAKEVHAKFVYGLLHIVMPKRGFSVPNHKQPPQLEQCEVTERSTLAENINSQDQEVDESPTLPQTSSVTEKIEDLRSKSLVNVAVVVGMVVCLGAYVMYSYWSLYDED